MFISLQEWKPEDLADYRTEKETVKLFQFHKEQARIVEKQIVGILTNLGFSHYVKKEDKVYVKRRIKFRSANVSPFSYEYRVSEMPYGVKKTDIAQDWVANEVSSTIGKKVHIDLDLNGLRITVEVGSTLSIPDFASFSDFDKMKNTMPPLSFYAGKTTNGADVYRNLAEAPHMIVAGQTGGGKSNLLNGIICGYLLRQPPSKVQLLLFDLKGGVEFDAFYGIPHLWKFEGDKDGIIEYPENILPALAAILDECNRRLKKLKDAKVKNLPEFNRGKHAKNQMPYIVGIFDEYTTARKLAGEKVETLLSTIANLSRAAGIHFIIGTQYPKSDVLSTLISVNFTWRIAFNMTTAASQSVLGNWDASGLTPTGRAILQSSEGEIYIQTPRITPNTVHSIVASVKQGTGGVIIRSLDPEELLEWALINTGGKLERDTLFNQFRERITIAALNDLLHSMENKEYEVQGSLYRIRAPAGNIARRMEIMDGSRFDEPENDKQQTTVTRDEDVTT